MSNTKTRIEWQGTLTKDNIGEVTLLLREVLGDIPDAKLHTYIRWQETPNVQPQVIQGELLDGRIRMSAQRNMIILQHPGVWATVALAEGYHEGDGSYVTIHPDFVVISRNEDGQRVNEMFLVEGAE